MNKSGVRTKVKKMLYLKKNSQSENTFGSSSEKYQY